MSSRPLLKTKLPYPENFETTEEALSYVVKTINSTMVESSIGGVEASGTYSFSATSGRGSQTITIGHELGSTPSGLVVSYLTASYSGADAAKVSAPVITVISLSENQAVINISSVNYAAGGATISGAFKILLLR